MPEVGDVDDLLYFETVIFKRTTENVSEDIGAEVAYV